MLLIFVFPPFFLSLRRVVAYGCPLCMCVGVRVGLCGSVHIHTHYKCLTDVCELEQRELKFYSEKGRMRLGPEENQYIAS